MKTPDLTAAVARATSLPDRGVRAVMRLLDEGATVPFIARYRKEATGGLDEVAIRAISEVASQTRELEKRRAAIIASVREQGALSPELERKLRAADTRVLLEDLYLPYRPKRKTRASKARALGLAPLADAMLQLRGGSPRREAQRYVRAEVADVDAALAGARDIVAEIVAERADVRALVRDQYRRHARLSAKAIKKATEGKRTRFEAYYQFEERASRVPSHRYLAIARGEDEGVLRVGLTLDEDRVIRDVLRAVAHTNRSPWYPHLEHAVADGFKRLIKPAVTRELRAELKTAADETAARVFAENLHALLMAAPLGRRPVVGIDPGLRTGCKLAAVDATGRYLDHATIYPHTGRAEQADKALAAFLRRHQPAAIAVGNGTASRETVDFARAVADRVAGGDCVVVTVSEDGASVYSASEVAREELGQLDVSIRGAVSIARRLQDPLAELVKIEPRSLGVGQYQHDVDQKRLAERLDAVVESAVNQVGVELNLASPQLLAHVAGIGPRLARAIVSHRDARGPFPSRRALLKVAGLGAKTYEQAAGFLRIKDGSHPLDGSAVHPERYALVERIAEDHGTTLRGLIGRPEAVSRLDLSRYERPGEVGAATLADIAAELAKPGRDPRAAFEAPRFDDRVREIGDLEQGMSLEGVVSNVTAVGAFVDIGVKQDGLVHISELADGWVSDPHEVVRPGQRIRVRVLSVDLERGRIALSAKQRGRA